MSSWLRSIPKQGAVLKPSALASIEAPSSDVPVVAVSMEVKQFPSPDIFPRQNRRQAPFNSNIISEPPRQPKPQQQQQQQQQQQPQRASRTAPAQAPVVKPNVKQVTRPTHPEVTVVIPLYNGFEFLEGSLESVRRQTYKNWVGVIGINGHGKTGEPVFSKVKALVTSLGLSDVFTVVNLPDVKGAAGAITEIVKTNVETDLVAHLDCDDIWLPKKLETQVKVMNEDEELGICGTMCRYFGESSDIPTLPTGELRKVDFEKKNPLIHSSILIRRDFADYTDEFVAYDYDCWIRSVLGGIKIANVDAILVFHRIHMKSFYNASNKQDPEAVRLKYNLA